MLTFENELYKWVEAIWENGHISRIYYGGLFPYRYPYVGKSKANINDLFWDEQ